jgi:hypothetical protein
MWSLIKSFPIIKPAKQNHSSINILFHFPVPPKLPECE